MGLLRFYKQTACHTLCMQGGIQHSVRHKREKASRKNNEMQARKTWKIMKNPCPTHSDPARIDPRRLRRLPKHPQASQNGARSVPRVSQDGPKSAQGRPRDAPRGTQGRPRSSQRSPGEGPRHPRGPKIGQKSAKMSSESNKYNVMLEFSPGYRFASVLRMRFHEFLFAQQSEQSSGHRSHTGFSQSKRVPAHWTNRSFRTTAARNL